METKETKNIYGKLMEARIRLQEKNLKKSGRSKSSCFSYYELSDFLPEINRIFVDLKLYSMFSINHEKVATLCIINEENTTENVVYQSPIGEVELRGCSAIQGIGAAHTYMKRYLYMNALEIVENDQLDAQAGNIDEIEGIKNLEDLNKVYARLSNIKHTDTTWKSRMKNKADSLNVHFNRALNRFESVEEKPSSTITGGIPNGCAGEMRVSA
jgi:hypothetical protein